MVKGLAAWNRLPPAAVRSTEANAEYVKERPEREAPNEN